MGQQKAHSKSGTSLCFLRLKIGLSSNSFKGENCVGYKDSERGLALPPNAKMHLIWKYLLVEVFPYVLYNKAIAVRLFTRF